jgi:uncharacterized integral membrane protein
MANMPAPNLLIIDLYILLFVTDVESWRIGARQDGAMTTSGHHRRLIAWVVLFGLIALTLLAVLLAAAAASTVLVDMIPGGDAGIGTSPALESARATMAWSFPSLVAVIAVGVTGPLLLRARAKGAGH